MHSLYMYVCNSPFTMLELIRHPVSPISTFVKVIGGGVHLAWQIYLQELASGRLVSVLVRGLIPKCM